MTILLLAGVLVALAAAPANAADCPPIRGAVCGSLTVPLDRANPAAGTTPVGYVLVRHRRPGPAVSAIVPNPGGPGDSATFLSTGYAELLEPLLDDHDLLIVDPRGAGRSGPLDCGVDASTALTSRSVWLRGQERCGRGLGERARADLAELSERLRRAPLRYEAGGIAWRLDDTALAGLVYNADPAGLGRLPAALRAAVRGDAGRLLALAKARPPAAGRASRSAESATSPAAGAAGPPPGFNIAQGIAVMCNDYPTLWDRSAPPRVRRRQYERARSALPERAFAPFGSRSWPRAIFDAGDTCLRWPDRHGPRQPTGGPFPDVPVLVLSGELDPNTPTSAGRRVARRFRRASVVEVPNAGHVPEQSEPCAGAIEVGFLRTLRVPDTSCLRDIAPVQVEAEERQVWIRPSRTSSPSIAIP